jgi:hypothetical protein
VALGATVLDEVGDDDEGGGLRVVVCRSPGGFVFCLTRWRPEGTARGAVREGLDCVLDQVCLDIPRSRYAAETAFWSRLTGWAVVDEGDTEFERMDPPDRGLASRGGIPVRFLLQRLDDADGHVRGHADLACRDREAEATRHVALGATRVRTGRGWVVMRDPSGRVYCCTRRHPVTGDTAPG